MISKKCKLLFLNQRFELKIVVGSCGLDSVWAFWKMESGYSGIMRWHQVINVDPEKLGVGIIFFKGSSQFSLTNQVDAWHNGGTW